MCFDVYITREFASFLMSHLIQVFGETFEAEDLYKKVCMGRNFFVPMVTIGFDSEMA